MSNTNGSMKLSLSARQMRALESHFSVSESDGALVLDVDLLERVGLNADGSWKPELNALHASANLVELATALKAATDQEALYRFNYDTAATNDRAAIRGEFAAADATLQGNIDAEATARSAGDSALQSNIDAEAAARSAADTAIIGGASEPFNTLGKVEARIGEEQGARSAADTTLQNNIDAEASARAAADTAIIGGAGDQFNTLGKVELRVGEEASARAAADNAATTDRAAIRGEFATADAAIKSELDATQVGAGLAEDGAYVAEPTAHYINDASSLADADNKLDAAIKVVSDGLAQELLDRAAAVDAEEQRALAAEASLSSEIAVEKGRIDAILDASVADKDSFAEIVTFINSVDTENDTAFGTHVTNYNARVIAVDAALLAEENARIAGDAAVTAAFQAADVTMQAELDATQAGAGLGVDGSYSANGSANYISAATHLADADNKLDAAIKVVADGLAQELLDRAADVDAEEQRALAAEGVLQGLINDEVTARSDADTAATTDRAAIRSEFAAADTAIIGGAGDQFNTLGKVELRVGEEAQARSDADAAATTDRAAIRSEFAAEDVILDGKITAEKNRAEAVEGDLGNLQIPAGNLVEAINGVVGTSMQNFQGVYAAEELHHSHYYEMQVDGGNGFVHVGPGGFGVGVTLAQVLAKPDDNTPEKAAWEAIVGQAFPGLEPGMTDPERAAKIYKVVKHGLKVFVNGVLAPMHRYPASGDFVMSDSPSVDEFQFSADGTKVLAPSGFPVMAGEFAVMMLG